ncbi:hypothetical protein [Peptoanaerobacter stomatis]|uniref:hypothetical protein n=1 Tax=Peptoanaerobacter stomatis TaxID=796937 RepID=UPI003F9F82B6
MKKLFKSKSIKTDITFSFVLIILISNILLFVFNNQILRKYFSLQVNDSIEVITKQAADIIEEDIKSTESQVDALSKTWAFTKNLDKNQIADFTKTLRNQWDLSNLHISTQKETDLISTKRPQNGTQIKENILKEV